MSEEFYCANTVYHEGRGEPLYGQAGIAHVILNRAIIRKLTIKEVVFEPWQFSCYNNNKRPSITNYDAFITAMKMTQRAIDERLYGFNFYGADHYHATYMNPYPSWIHSMTKVAEVGQHIFYKG